MRREEEKDSKLIKATESGQPPLGSKDDGIKDISPNQEEPPRSGRGTPLLYYFRKLKNIKTTEDEEDTIFEKILYIGSIALAIIFFPIAFFLCIAVVKEHERLVVFRLGRVRKGILGPGISWVLPCIDSWINVDMRTICEVVPSQDILTKDSVTIRVDAVLYYCIYSPMDAVIQVANVYEATMMIAQTTLRTIVGSKSLIQLLTSREALSREIGYVVDGITERWGVRVERVELKDIRLPESLQRSLASEAEAHREARAKIISAEGELKASQALKDASDVMAENKITLQLRHLQILTLIASERQCHIIYPIPMDMMTPFEVKSSGNSNKPDDGNDSGIDDRPITFITSNFSNPNPQRKISFRIDVPDVDPSEPNEDVDRKPAADQNTNNTDRQPMPRRSRRNRTTLDLMPLNPERPEIGSRLQVVRSNDSNTSNDNQRAENPPRDETKPGDFFFFDQASYRKLCFPYVSCLSRDTGIAGDQEIGTLGHRIAWFVYRRRGMSKPLK
ncbi:stomatin-like protein 3 [Drosophila tropicalis]|uniref:stomatin-like protein 3 n=1 Tax=Drosophila tropicalis TaxID=46794 RepID=UPI0035ABC09C